MKEHPMTPQQIQHVRTSFALVAPIADQAAALFYANLFDADPSLRPMFRSDLGHQGERLMAMIGAAVGLLDQPQRLMPALHALGARHAGYGVREPHYATVGQALIQTLSQGLGDAFTPEVAEAWAAMYGVVSREMHRAAQPAAAMA
jgi:hemoglobin-like flavoprotein